MVNILFLRPMKCLRWPTLLAVLFYLFFIALVLISTIGSISKMLSSKEETATAKVKDTVAIIESGKRLQPEIILMAEKTPITNRTLQKAFQSADTNHDTYLDIQELAKYINKKIMQHIEWAIKMNRIEFSRVDKDPGDGLITWEEYHTFFLKEHGLAENEIKDHSEAKHSSLDRKAKEEMMRDKARWSEAAKTDFFSLTIDEFLAFRHPESSVSNLLSLVDDLLRLFDNDGDDQLSIEEFAEVTTYDDDDLFRKSVISKTVEERKAEFKRIVDKNNDGRADRGELLNYVNPKHPRYAVQESISLINLSDANKDGKLSMQEVQNEANLFLRSKMIDTANSFHQEF